MSPALHPTRQAYAEHIRRELQWEVPRLLPGPQLVLEPRRCTATDRAVASLQPDPTTQLDRHDTESVCAARPSIEPGRIAILAALANTARADAAQLNG